MQCCRISCYRPTGCAVRRCPPLLIVACTMDIVLLASLPVLPLSLFPSLSLSLSAHLTFLISFKINSVASRLLNVKLCNKALPDKKSRIDDTKRNGVPKCFISELFSRKQFEQIHVCLFYSIYVHLSSCLLAGHEQKNINKCQNINCHNPSCYNPLIKLVMNDTFLHNPIK